MPAALLIFNFLFHLMKKKTIFCPCGTGKEYAQCCKVFHLGILPENAMLLMRSRYSAYALGNVNYIIDTTHPKNVHYLNDKTTWKKSIFQFSNTTSFNRLEVHEFSEEGNFATVSFTASISQEGQDVSFTEKSLFEKVEFKWLYLSGEIS